jgi:hypothetical protein
MLPHERAWMDTNHPGMASRWMANANASSESNESSKPGLKKLPRAPESKRDWGALVPSPQNRLKLSKRASEKDSMEEDGTEGTPEGATGKMKIKTTNVLEPLAKRDSNLAARKKV